MDSIIYYTILCGVCCLVYFVIWMIDGIWWGNQIGKGVKFEKWFEKECREKKILRIKILYFLRDCLGLGYLRKLLKQSATTKIKGLSLKEYSDLLEQLETR